MNGNGVVRELPAKVGALAYLVERFGVPTLYLAVTLVIFGVYARWSRSDLADAADRAKQSQTAFLEALKANTEAVERSALATERNGDKLDALKDALQLHLQTDHRR